MAPDNAPPLSPEPEGRAAALAEEVRQLKALLVELQAELKPAIQSSLRERSSELQRLGGEMAEREAQARRLRGELDEALVRTRDLEREVERWRGAAQRGVEEVAEKAREAAQRFEARTDELNQALAAVRRQLQASRAQSEAAVQARETAVRDLERTRRRAGALKARVLRREARRVQMMTSLSWRITAPLRWLALATRRMLLGGARLRRRLFKPGA